MQFHSILIHFSVAFKTDGLSGTMRNKEAALAVNDNFVAHATLLCLYFLYGHLIPILRRVFCKA